MIFTDWTFFVFFAVAFSVYWAVPSNGARKVWLLACSVVFYAMWDWRFVGLVLSVIANTYIVTLAIAHQRRLGRSGRLILTAGVSISLGVLGLFKYYNFFVATLGRMISIDATIAGIILPIGISFYTFHSISYMVDTYRGKITPTRNFVDVALYVLFFPQLVAGPIVRATDLLPQMTMARTFPTAVETKAFLLLFLIGYFKKAVISDNISPLVDGFYAAPAKYGAGDALIATIGYAVQIYCDFSGYTDMAIAIAGLLGYQLRPNFAQPYLAASLIDFWRRWHISLSSWLRDYLYIPLGGNRHGNQSRNLMITMLLGGLWHGASWTFVAWGALHGVGLVVNRAWRSMRRVDAELERYSLIGNLATFAFVWFAWIFFRAPDFPTASLVISRLIELEPPVQMSWPYAMAALASLTVLHVLFYFANLQRLARQVGAEAFAFGYGCAVAAMLPFVNVAAQPFIYFQF
jgi:alginate O-acetyltransferase complex protein AlgI